MPNYSVEPCWEVVNTAQFATGIDGNGASVTLSCPFDQRFVVASDLLSNRRVWPQSTGTGAPRVSNVDISGFGPLGDVVVGSEQQIVYEEGRLDVTYEPLAAEINPTPEIDLIVASMESAKVLGFR